MSLTTRTALSAAIVSLIAACGGGESSSSTAASTSSTATSQASAMQRLRALAAGGGSTSAAATTITNAQFFQWAGVLLPTVFPPNPGSMTLNAEGLVWDIRAYSNGMYLAVASNGRAYGLGPITGNALVDLGVMQGFSAQVCSTIDCNPPTGGGGGGTGSLNGCTMPASETLRTGARFETVYVSSVLVAPASTGEFTITGVVDGPAQFEGQSAIKSTTTIRGVQHGFSLDSTDLAYQVAAGNELTRTLGSEASISFQGFPATVKLVYAAPASLNDEFTLTSGGSLTKTETSTSTTTIPSLPIPMPPSTSTSSSTHTYEGRETVTVLGRTFETCRYKMVTPDTPGMTMSWLIVGKGLAAKVERKSATGAVEYRDELKSGSINGAPL